MNRILSFAIFFLTSINILGRVSISTDFLKGTEWICMQLNVEIRKSEMSFTDSKVAIKLFFQSLGKTVEQTFPYYMCDEYPDSFDESKVGKGTSGRFLVRRTKNGFVCMEIVKITSTDLQMVRALGKGEEAIGGVEPVTYYRK